MNKDTAIVMFSYNRPDHFGKVFRALIKNPEFKNLNVVIYHDGKRINEKGRWEDMRKLGIEIAKKYSNVRFNSITKNKGCRQSIIDGITAVLKEYESVIIIEDDVLVSSSFLCYMLSAIDYYKNIKQVGCISGYNHPPQLMPIPENYKNDVYFTLRTCSWGWAIWRDRWNDIDWAVKDFGDLKFNIRQRKAFSIWGDDLFGMLDAQMRGKINAWDIALTYNFFKNNLYTVYPIQSYVENIGHDNSGDNCKLTNKELFINKELNEKKDVEFVMPVIDPKITESFRKVYRRDYMYYKRKITAKFEQFFLR